MKPLDGIKILDLSWVIAGPHATRILCDLGAEVIKVSSAKNPDVAQGMVHMVRQLQPGPTGIPLEIYCFSARQAWVEYERVQADLFDHLFAVLPLFNLRIFQYPSDSFTVVGK